MATYATLKIIDANHIAVNRFHTTEFLVGHSPRQDFCFIFLSDVLEQHPHHVCANYQYFYRSHSYLGASCKEYEVLYRTSLHLTYHVTYF